MPAQLARFGSDGTAERGFGLIDLMLVIAIIAILAANLLPSYLDAVKESKLSRIQGDVAAIARQAAVYIGQNPPDDRASPPTLDTLVAAGLVDPRLDDGILHGYFFVLQVAPDGVSFDVIAVPIRSGVTGDKRVSTDESEVVTVEDHPDATAGEEAFIEAVQQAAIDAIRSLHELSVGAALSRTRKLVQDPTIADILVGAFDADGDDQLSGDELLYPDLLSLARGIASLFENPIPGFSGDDADATSVLDDFLATVRAEMMIDEADYDDLPSIPEAVPSDPFALLDLVPGGPISGLKALIKNRVPDDPSKNRVVFVSKDPRIAIGVPGSSDDPRCSFGNGGSVEVYSPTSGQQFTQFLPCDNWKLLGRETKPRGYKYLDKDLLRGPCKLVLVRAGKVAKAVCLGKGPFGLTLDLAEGSPQDEIYIKITMGAGSITHCAQFGGEITRDGTDGKTFLAKNSQREVCCPHSCVHDECSEGEPLDPACDSCVASICALDPSCCTSSWHPICVEAVSSVCGLPECSPSTEQWCVDSFPGCFGPCPTGGSCSSQGSFCECGAGSTDDCGDTFPQCNGTCPEPYVCALRYDAVQDYCKCVEDETRMPCAVTTYPSCLGTCPEGSTCGFQPLVGEACSCLPDLPSE
jgi:competence protein ComGC